MPKPNSSSSPKNLRNSPRVDYKSPVDLILNGRLYKEVSVNINETGVFIKSNRLEDYKLFDKLLLSFQTEDLKPVKRMGRIVRKTNEGIGVVYLDNDYPRFYTDK